MLGRLKLWCRENRMKATLTGVLLASTFILSAVLLPVCLTVGCPPKKSHQQPVRNNTNRLIFQFEDYKKKLEQLVPPQLWDYYDEKILDSSGIHIASFNDTETLKEIREFIEGQSDLVNFIEDSALFTPEGRTLLSTDDPDDPLEPQQWFMSAIGAATAWNITLGAPAIVVAVIDTGCDLGHPDLVNNLWVNKGEIPNNGIDDDKNGYIDDVHGFDFAGDCPTDWRSPTTNCGGKPRPQDTHSHGTHCAGIIAAIHNNGIGVSGVAPSVKIMCLKVSDASGAFYPAHIFKAYDYATKMGAHVVSCSFGPSSPNMNPSPQDLQSMRNETRFYESAIYPLIQKGALVFSAAGNENNDLTRLPPGSSYNPCTIPAMNQTFQSKMVCVMATNEVDERWEETLSNNQVAGTNYGASVVDIGAPGRLILSTVPPLEDNGRVQYAYKTGSSMATPLTAGVGALLFSILGPPNATNKMAETVRQIILDSADAMRTKGLTKTNARLNAGAALNAALAHLNNSYLLFPSKPSQQDWATVQGAFNIAYRSPSQNNTKDMNNIQNFSHEWYTWQLIDAAHVTGQIATFQLIKQPTLAFVTIFSYFRPEVAGMYKIRLETAPQLPPTEIQVELGGRLLNIDELKQGVNLVVQEPNAYYKFEVRCLISVAAFVGVTFVPPQQHAFTYTQNFYLPMAPSSQPFIFPPPTSKMWQLYMNTTSPAPRLLSSLVLETQFSIKQILATDQLANSTRAGMGLVHTRIVHADQAGLMLTMGCSGSCSLAINTQTVLEVRAGSRQRSGCIVLSPHSPFHDLFVRFNISIIDLTWTPCNNPTLQLPIADIIQNDMVWRPTPQTDSYIGGMQCDVYQSSLEMQTASFEDIKRRYGPSPLLKFRLPSALAASSTVSSVINPYFSSSGCKPQKQVLQENLNQTCGTSFGLTLRDVYNGLPSTATAFYGHPLERYYIRCYAYWRGSFANGTISAHSLPSTYIRVQLGGQMVLASAIVTAVRAAPHATIINNHYQLLVYEAMALPGFALIGLQEGLLRTPIIITNQDMVLPIPVSIAPNNNNKMQATVSQVSFARTIPGLDIAMPNTNTINTSNTSKNTPLVFNAPMNVQPLRSVGVFQSPVLAGNSLSMRFRPIKRQALSFHVGNITLFMCQSAATAITTYVTQINMPVGSTYDFDVFSSAPFLMFDVVQPPSIAGPLQATRFWQ